ncbi:MAG: hypothetical protein FWD77_07860 [Betaproteobacteria bacterium]|nr:hypothetical protein [Betaproteobacteria bacterium]
MKPLLPLSAIPAIVTCIFMFNIVPALGGKFEGLVDLPRSTLFLLNWYRLLAFLPLLVFVLIYFLWPSSGNDKAKQLITHYLTLLSCLALLIWTIMACYFIPMSNI